MSNVIYYQLRDSKNLEIYGRGYCFKDAQDLRKEFLEFWGYELFIEEQHS